MTKVALITGGAHRIGADIVHSLHAAGFSIALHYQTSQQAADELVNQLNNIRDNSAAAFACDLNSIGEIQSLAEKVQRQWNRVDLLINNASQFHPTPIGEITEDSWDKLINSNVKGALFLSQALTPTLKKQQGCIINMIDIHAERPLKNHSVYCMAKAALAMMTKSLAKDLGPEIRVNGIAPGAILWPEPQLEQKPEPEPERKQKESEQQAIIAHSALKRLGQPQDISNTVLFLAENAPYITGQIITVDGGRTLNN